MIGIALILGASAQAGPADLSRCKNGEWLRLAFRNQGECVSLLARGGQIWNLADDFRVAPSQQNPNPDGAGNPAVWHFASVSLARDPATYALYRDYTVFSDNFEGWNADGPDVLPLVSLIRSLRVMSLHPGTDRLTVVGWRSPVTGVVTVRGGFAQDGSQTCGTGVGWSIDTTAATLASGVLATGDGVSFALSTPVTAGDVLFFSVAPNGDSNCDSTFLDLTISDPAASR
jgi:hypothetical protein